MNKVLKITLIVVAALVVVGGVFFASLWWARARSSAFYAAGPMPGVGRGYQPDFGPATRGRGYDQGRPGQGYGPGGMMDRRFDRNRPGFGPGGMTGRRPNFGPAGKAAAVQPLTVDEAKGAAQKAIDSLGISGLKIDEVMIFNNNAYVVVKEDSTGMGAFELLVNPVSKVAYPEQGPDMMWNLKYGGVVHAMMTNGRGGIFGFLNQQKVTPPSGVSADMPVTDDQAVKAAQDFLDKYQKGTTAASDPIKFYGYYTVDFTKDGKVVGMLSVNGFNSQVFIHTWHGTFVEESQAK
jgi:hypothetical protein